METNILPYQHSDKLPSISVVMVSYMTGPALNEAVLSVLNDPDITELVIVDNGNPEPARQSLWELVFNDKRVRILQGHGNIGFARGCNYGAAQAKGHYLVFLNPDAVIESGAARYLVNSGEGLNRPWLTGGLLRNISGHEQRGSRRGELTPLSAVISFTPLHKLPFLRSVHKEHEAMPKSAIPMKVLSGAFLATDRQSFEDLGGFDTGYFLHVEDIDICRRARHIGGETYFAPHAVAKHYGSTSRVRRQDVEWYKLKGFIRYFWMHYPARGARLITLLSVPFMTIAIMGRAWWLSIKGVLQALNLGVLRK